MLPDLEPGALVSSSLVIFLAAVLRGFSGFGFALAAVPLLTFSLPPSQVVPVAMVLQFFAGIIDLPAARTICDRPSLRWLVPGAVIGSPLGTWVLAVVSPSAAQFMIAGVCGIAVAALGFGLTFGRSPGSLVTAFVGMMSGLFNGLAAMPGPPAIAFYMASPLKATEVRASLMVFFLSTSIIGIAGLVMNGLLSMTVLKLAALGFPLLAAGTRVGAFAFRRSSGGRHRMVSLVILAAIAVACAVKAVGGLT